MTCSSERDTDRFPESRSEINGNKRNGDGARQRVVIIGLDGTPFSFLDHEIASGNLPNIARITAKGNLARMETEVPAISSVAWTSFMTGKNPGEHGIFGFTDRKLGTWELFFPNYSNVQVTPIWDQISSKGGRCCVLNVPSTFPARPLNGVMVSGFVAPSLERAVYPTEAYEYLSGMGYRIDANAAKARESLDLLLEDLHETLEKRREAMLHFWSQEDWDFFMNVFTGTDRLHHFFWRYYEEEDATYHSEFMRYYRRLDEIIGEFVSELADDVVLIMLSDHGFCSVKKDVFLNGFLEQEGLLSFKCQEPQTIADIDAESTLAYCLDPGRIYINRYGREPNGAVKPDMIEGLQQRIIDGLLALKDPENSESLICAVKTRASLYNGKMLDIIPDIIAIPCNGYDLKGRMSSAVISPAGIITGMHTHDDAFVFIDGKINNKGPSHIRELAPLIIQASCGNY